MPKTSGSITAALEVVRPLNCLMAAFASMLGYWVSVKAFAFPSELFFTAAATFAICGGGQAINDYYDRELDKRSEKKSRPIASGRLSARSGLVLSLALFVVGIGLARLVNDSAFGIAVAFSIILFAYSSRLGRMKYFGNAIVALATAFTYYMGASISGQYLLASVLAGASFFSTWGREIVKDLEDTAIDKGHKTTLPMLWGKSWAVRTAHVVTYVSMAFGIVPLALGLQTSTAYALLLLACFAAFLVSLSHLRNGEYAKSQGMYKAAMLIGLAAYASLVF